MALSSSAACGQCATDADCDDGIDCTADQCFNGTCRNHPADSVCDDQLFCTGVETCDPNVGCVAGADPCPYTPCIENESNCEPCTSDAQCDDGLFCTGTETCVAGVCTAGTAPDCDDGVSCTVDVCNNVIGACVHIANNTLCDDGLFCNGAEVCDPALDCQPGTPVLCADAVPCTIDTCNEDTDSCDHTPDDSECSDGISCTIESCTPFGCRYGRPLDALCDDDVFCNGAETCDPFLDCQPGTPPACDDEIDCTVDTCDGTDDVCVHTPDDTQCTDNVACTIDVCDPAGGCHFLLNDAACDDGNPCTTDTCTPTGCVFTPTDSLCDDGLYCNGVETCDAVLGCQAGDPVVCDDGVDCTIGICDEVNDTCLHSPDNSRCDDGVGCTADICLPWGCLNIPKAVLCDDGVFCNGAEQCDPVLDCQPGTPPTCDDGGPCTIDTCNGTTDACEHVPDDTLCDDGIACTNDSCLSNGLCLHGLDDSICEDGLFCNGDEFCDPSQGCQSGPLPTCDDGIPCTIGTCDPTLDTCVQTPDHSVCVDSISCTTDTCDPDLGCLNTPNNAACDDGVACTNDICSTLFGCFNLTNHPFCSDGLYCNGLETCHRTLDCQAGPPPDCDDGVACTVDSCNEDTDTCDNIPDDNLCDDGIPCTDEACTVTGCVQTGQNHAYCDDDLFCNGVELCDWALGCVVGEPPDCNDLLDCTDDSCDETDDVCVNTVTCDDGVACTADICTTTGCVFAPDHGSCDDGVGCTYDYCHSAADCLNEPLDSWCDDESTCTGVETCDPILDCVGGTSGCAPGEVCCNEECVECCTSADCPPGEWCQVFTHTCQPFIDPDPD